MSNLIKYKGFEIPQPTPANLGGEALANNFKRLGVLHKDWSFNCMP